MDRVLERELMDDAQRVQAYASADFSASNQLFVNQFLSDYPNLSGSVVDLGTGPGDVVIRLAKAKPALAITAVDGSEAMIRLAEVAIRAQALDRKIVLLCGRIPALPLPDASFDAVLSKDLLHHLPDPKVFWVEARRLARPGGILFVMDLVRPDSLAEAKRMVQEVTGNESPLLQEDFFNSLCAAFTPEEVEDEVRKAGLKLNCSRAGDRHMLIQGRLA
jgi:ubiquinone/menaquinone biosynthesis C-methylase UbiE